MKKDTVNTMIMPALAMRGLVVFPKLVVHFDVARRKSAEALKAALADDKLVFLTAQQDISVDEPAQKDLYKIGVVAQIRQILKTPDNVTRVLVEGLYKARLVSIVSDSTYMVGEIKRLPDDMKIKSDDLDITALMRSLKSVFERYSVNMPKMPKEMMVSILNEKNPQSVFESLAFNLPLAVDDKQQLLEANCLEKKMETLISILTREVEVLDLERQIEENVREQIDKGQREYYLREQMKVISSQLGDDDSSQEEAFDYMERIEALKLPDETHNKLMKEAERLMRMSPSSQETYVVRNYLDTCLELPWNTYSKDNIDIHRARTILDKDHYGLKKVKERILEIISVKALSPDVKGQIICLVGPPGIGKTSIGKSVARALKRKYARISLGGVKDESDIRGHRKTYIGSMPGRIISAVKTAGTKNCLVLLDEIDKMSNDYRGDPSSAMLEVLDSEQNVEFRDHYIEVPFDLSDVVFITTANTTDTIAQPLLDRMEVIELPSYTREEKFHIAKEHLVPKQLKKNGLKGTQCKLSDDAIYSLIDSYTKEAGVRSLERSIASLCRKAAKDIVEKEVKKVSFTESNLYDYLGSKKYTDDELSKSDEVGVVNGLAWTTVGGVVMPLEAIILEGKGNVETTGSLGDVMKESAKLAVSYVRSVADKYGIDKDFYKNNDIHIHAPEGATPKDGPSAGVTMVTALVSALSNRAIRHDVAMTGEITLHGKVLAIGGLREKTMAAYKAGMKTVIVPQANKPDMDEVDDVVKLSMNFVFASDLEQVLDTALVSKEEQHTDIIIPPKTKVAKEKTRKLQS